LLRLFINHALIFFRKLKVDILNHNNKMQVDQLMPYIVQALAETSNPNNE
jgi:hypothetical protein